MAKSVDQMTIGEKVALAMQKFMEDTAYAAGNYAKENETAAGSMTTLKAAWSNFLAGNLSFDKVVDSAYQAMSIALKTVGLDAYQPFLDSARDTVNQVVKILGMEDGEVDEEGLTKSEKLRKLFTDTFKNIFDEVALKAPEWIGTVFSSLTTAFGDVNTVLPSALQMATTLFASLREGFKQLKEPLLDGTETIAGDTLGIFTQFKADMLATGLEFIGAFAQGISDDLAKGENSSVQKALNEGIGDVLEALQFSGPAVVTAAGNLITALAGALANEDTGTKLAGFVSDLIGSIAKLLTDGKMLSNVAGAILNLGNALLTGIFDGLGQAATTIWESITNQDDGSVPESVKTLQKAFAGILADSAAAEGAYSSAMADIQARADLAEKYLDVLEAYEQLEDPSDEMTQDALNATQALLNLYPELKKNVDSNTGFFNDNTKAIRANIAALQDLAKQQAYEKLTSEMTEQQANLIVQKVNAQAELNSRQAAYNKAQADYKAFQGYSASRWENRDETGRYQLNTTAAQLMKDALGEETFARAFQTLADGSALSTGDSSKIYDPLFQKAEEYYANQLSEAEANVAAVQETMTAIDTAIEEIKTKAAELTATWQETYGAAASEAGTAADAANGVKAALDAIPGDYDANVNLHINGGNPSDIFGNQPKTYNASGLGYVPYDNYVSRLHRGEMVLTRQQAEGYRQGSGAAGRQYAVSASLNVGSMTLNNGMDAQRVAQALSKETTRQVRALGRRKG